MELSLGHSLNTDREDHGLRSSQSIRSYERSTGVSLQADLRFQPVDSSPSSLPEEIFPDVVDRKS